MAFNTTIQQRLLTMSAQNFRPTYMRQPIQRLVDSVSPTIEAGKLY